MIKKYKCDQCKNYYSEQQLEGQFICPECLQQIDKKNCRNFPQNDQEETDCYDEECDMDEDDQYDDEDQIDYSVNEEYDKDLNDLYDNDDEDDYKDY